MKDENIRVRPKRSAKNFVHDNAYTLDKLFTDYEKNKLPNELSPFFTRPVYYGTSAQINNSRFDKVNV